MPYPPTVPTGARINTTPQVDLHPADHIEIHAAISDIINELGSDPSSGSADLTARLGVLNPIGEMRMFGGASAPSGWALCNGDAVSRTTYAALYAVLGTAYGIGDDSTTFNLPDMRNRFPVGLGTTAWSDTRGEAGGSKDAVAVAHTHGHPNHDHGHSISATSAQGTHAHVETGGSSVNPPGGWLYQSAYDGVNFNTMVGSGLEGSGSTIKYTQPSTASTSAGEITTTISGGVSAGNAGTTSSQAPTAAGADANLPPYRVVNFIIRLS